MTTDTNCNPAEVLEGVIGLVIAAMAAVDPAALAPDSDLYELGLDSTTAVNLMLAIEERFAITFPDSMLDDATFRSPGALTAAVRTLLG